MSVWSICADQEPEFGTIWLMRWPGPVLVPALIKSAGTRQAFLSADKARCAQIKLTSTPVPVSSAASWFDTGTQGLGMLTRSPLRRVSAKSALSDHSLIAM